MFFLNESQALITYHAFCLCEDGLEIQDENGFKHELHTI